MNIFIFAFVVGSYSSTPLMMLILICGKYLPVAGNKMNEHTIMML